MKIGRERRGEEKGREKRKGKKEDKLVKNTWQIF